MYRLSLRFGFYCSFKPRYTRSLRFYTTSLTPPAIEWAGELIYSPVACAFLRKWPDLISLKAARRDVVRRFFHAHRVHRADVIERRLDQIAKARALTTDDAVVSVSALTCRMLVGQLETLARSIAEYEKQIALCFVEHPEADLFCHLPGAGKNLAPRLLVAFGTQRDRYPTAANLQRFVGIAPVTEKSGNRRWIHWRWSAPKFLRQTFHEWAGVTVQHSTWARAYYTLQKSRGKQHHAIVRSLAFKWIRILWRCWMDRIPYDETIYLKTLTKRNVPLLKPCYEKN